MTIDLKSLFDIDHQQNEKVIEKLLIALKSGFGQEFDYIKFKKSYLSLIEMGMDADTAIKSAYMTASTMGFTKEKLIQNIALYKNLLIKEREQFVQALKHQISVNIDSKSIDIKNLVSKKEENERKIIELQNQRQIIDNEISKLQEQIASNTDKIHATRDQFKSSFDYIYDKLEQDESRFNIIL